MISEVDRIVPALPQESETYRTLVNPRHVTIYLSQRPCKGK